MNTFILQHDFYNRSPLAVAPDLLGKVLVRRIGNHLRSGRIIEVEAYLGTHDEASHSFKGETPRTKSLFGSAGHAYVYSIHMYHCLDIVTEAPGIPSSVLIRALEPIEGIAEMQSARKKDLLKDLTSGPGKLCQALSITKELDGVDMTYPASGLYVTDDGFKAHSFVTTPRIGISKAKDQLLRFHLLAINDVQG